MKTILITLTILLASQNCLAAKESKFSKNMKSIIAGLCFVAGGAVFLTHTEAMDDMEPAFLTVLEIPIGIGTVGVGGYYLFQIEF